MRMEEENSREAAEKLQQIGSSILGAARDELYLGLRFLDVAKMISQVWLPIRITIFLLWRKTEKVRK